MHPLSTELQDIVGEYAERLRQMPEAVFSARPAPGKWSKKEILGHLIDSAQNNIQRFVRAQHEPGPVRILYRQDDWVALQNYQAYAGADLVQLWLLLNRHLGHIWTQMHAETWAVSCDIGKLSPELISLEGLALDYLRHLKHHLSQVE